MAASPGRCAKENTPKLPTLPLTLSNTSTLICRHTHTHTSLIPPPSPMLRLFPPLFPRSLPSNLPLFSISCSLFLPVSLRVQWGVFKLQVLVTDYSGFQFPPINTKVLPYFVTSLYSGEKCSVGLQLNFNHCDTPELLKAALFFHQPGRFALEWLTTYIHRLHVCTLYVSGRLQEFSIS